MDDRDLTETRPGWVRLALLWLLGTDLRLTILAVPPVLPLIHRDLNLNEQLVAALTGLPVLLFGIAAIPGSVLIARVGARRAAIAGALLVAVASALRGVGPSIAVLLITTAAMGAGVAVMQPALPALVARWFPHRVPLATALYANGLLIGEMVPASFTIPLVLPLLHGSWPGSFVFWSAPVLVTVLLVAFCTPEIPPAPQQHRVRWAPDWRDVRTWQLGCLLGGCGALYFGCNAFLPDYLHAIGRPALLNAALTALNTGQLPASLLIMWRGRDLVGQRWPFVLMGTVGLVSLAGLLVPSGAVIVAAAGVIGFTAAFTLILSLAMPPVLSGPEDVHRLAAGMLALGYCLTFLMPYVGGAVWDATHRTEAALLPGVAAALTTIVVGCTFRLGRSGAGHAAPARP